MLGVARTAALISITRKQAHEDIIVDRQGCIGRRGDPRSGTKDSFAIRSGRSDRLRIGRTTRFERSEMNRPETIEETGTKLTRGTGHDSTG